MTKDVYRALQATREIKAGCVWIQDHIPIISEMPHGGMKESGFGKDMSSYSFEEYTQVKHVIFDLTGTVEKEWHRTIFKVAKSIGSYTQESIRLLQRSYPPQLTLFQSLTETVRLRSNPTAPLTLPFQ